MTPRHAERPLRRSRRNTREQKRRYLVYVEGSNTERIYLQGVRRQLRGQPITIEIGNTYGEPVGLVRAAAKHKRRMDTDPAARFDEVWCVLDVEAPQPAPGLDQALTEARREGIRCALSNPCFELWLILHFRDHHSDLTSSQAQRELAGLLPGYDPAKGKAFNYESVRDAVFEASARAQRLAVRHDCQPDRCRHNPCTTVAHLLTALGAVPPPGAVPPQRRPPSRNHHPR
ncbi:RloB family protein [Streptomyces alkaliterrae]|uniref:RloB domain-containing protein n=1 Tax=Streptomyces alkaliterrae TaxID=2213162 RepID=A0A5P0YNR8_9ACTN|nr:RloB family protein [Streptomyces alkaliterrae]MBB1260299.1 RloB domain-containing protein [Streptomyces alkaliterrae]MQS01994.1 RloB domain-containing protein [Streptomyces alkaliterrae]